jgi:hypothetical protein
MATSGRVWTDRRTFDCAHVGKTVTIESRMVFPVGFLSDRPPRILSRTCDHLVSCHLQDRSACPMAVAHFAPRPH